MIARYYEASYSGLIYFITNSFALIVTIGSFSLESGVAYYIAAGQISTSKLANFSSYWTLLSTALSLLAIAICLSRGLISEIYSKYFFAAMCYVGGCMLVNFFSGAFYALKKFYYPNIIMIVINILLIILFPVIGRRSGKELYINIYFGGFLLQGILVAGLFYKKYGSSNILQLPAKKDLIKIFRYGFLAFMANLLFFLVYRVDYWFVQKYCTSTQLGNYIQVSKLAQLLFVVPSILASAVFPIIVGKKEQAIGEKIKIISRSCLLLYLFICLLLVATGYWLFPFIFGKSFSEMYKPFLLLVPGILALVMLYPLTAYYAGMKRISLNIKGMLLSLIIIVAGNFIITPVYGIEGAALTSSLGYIGYHGYLTWYFRKEHAISVKDFYGVTIADFYRARSIAIENLKQI